MLRWNKLNKKLEKALKILKQVEFFFKMYIAVTPE